MTGREVERLLVSRWGASTGHFLDRTGDPLERREVVALGEPGMDGGKKIARLVVLFLPAEHCGEVLGGTEFR
jgi:hypothetical protein